MYKKMQNKKKEVREMQHETFPAWIKTRLKRFSRK